MSWLELSESDRAFKTSCTVIKEWTDQETYDSDVNEILLAPDGKFWSYTEKGCSCGADENLSGPYDTELEAVASIDEWIREKLRPVVSEAEEQAASAEACRLAGLARYKELKEKYPNHSFDSETQAWMDSMENGTVDATPDFTTLVIGRVAS